MRGNMKEVVAKEFEAERFGARPESPTDYKLPEADYLDSNQLAGSPIVEWWRSFAHESGYNQEQFETAKRTEQEDKLKADGEFQKLLAEREKEILAMKPKADAFEQLRQVEIEDAKKSLGDKWDDEYQTLSIPALRKTTSLLSNSKVKVDGVDDGKIPDPPKVQLTEAQRKDAHEKFPYQTKEQAERNWFDVLRKTGKI
jgi:hypothetical protein